MLSTRVRFPFLLFALVSLLAAAVWGGCSGTPPPAQPAADTALAPQAAHSTAADTSGGVSAQDLKFTVPPEWIEEAPASSMRRAQYRLPRVAGDPEDGELVVFFFQGQGGSVQANIERWIGQFVKEDGSAATDQARTEKREVGGVPLTVVDISGTYMAAMGPMLSEVKAKPRFRMLAAVAETSNGPWFFKLTGPENTIAKWETGFRAFLDSIHP